MISNDIINKILPHSFVTFFFSFSLIIAVSIKNLRSPVWQYFSVISAPDGKKKAKCNMCKVEVPYLGGSTETMSNHLKHVHKSVKTEVNDGKPKTVQKPKTNTTRIWPF